MFLTEIDNITERLLSASCGFDSRRGRLKSGNDEQKMLCHKPLFYFYQTRKNRLGKNQR